MSLPQNNPQLAQALFDEAGDALFLLDPATDNILDVNPMAERLSGFARQELLQLQAAYLFRHTGQGGKQRLLGVLKNTVAFHSQEGFVLRTPADGVWIPVNITIARLHVEPNTLALITVRDVREQRSAHARLQETEAELRRVLASVSDCLWSAAIDETGLWQYRYFSPAIERIAGRGADYLRGGAHRWRSVVHPEDAARWDAARARWRSEQATQEEYRILAADGTVRWVRESVRATRAAGGGGLHLDGVIADITAHRQAEEARHGTEARYREVVENAHDVIYTHDLKGNFTSWNRGGERVLGYTAQEICQMNITAIIAPEQLEAARRMTARKLAGDQQTVYEITVLAKDGRRVSAEINSALQYEQGKPVGVLGIARDITERLELEDQLRQAQKMEAVGRLVGGIAHEFNNLLTVIQGFSEILASILPAADPTHDFAEQIVKAAQRAAELTSHLLAFGRKQMLSPRVSDLNRFVKEVVPILSRVLGEDIQVVTELRAGRCLVNVDDVQLHQAVLNLAINARDALPRGGRLTLRTADVEKDAAAARDLDDLAPGRYALLEVSDNGCGMTEEVMARLFEPFFTTKDVGKGTGLGLSMVYGFVKQSGGAVQVQSTSGQGATFRIYLPWIDADTPIPQPRAAAAPAREGTETILLVEDEPGVRLLARTVLADSGYTVLEAGGGRQALQIAKAHSGPIQLLLSDVVMPDLNGGELARLLTSLRPEMKSLFMSGHADSALMRFVPTKGAIRLLAKPFTRDELLSAVRELLAGQPPSPPLRKGGTEGVGEGLAVAAAPG